MDALPAISALASVGSGITGMVQSQTNQKMLKAEQRAAIDDSLREQARLAGAQRVAYAKGGVDVGSGTPLDVMAETAAEADLQALRIKYGYQAARTNQQTAGLSALAGGLAKGSDTLLTAWGRKQTGDPYIGDYYGRRDQFDPATATSYRLPPSRKR